MNKATIPGIIMLTLFIFLLSDPAFSQKEPMTPKYNKILFLAKVEQLDVKIKFEDAMVRSLKEKGYNAIPSDSYITTDDLSTTDKLSAKADTLKIDALLVFTVLKVESTVRNTPQVSASVGVPIRIGFMSAYVGTSVPLGGGPKEEKKVSIRAGFYNSRETPEPAWSLIMSGSLNKGTDPVISEVVKKTTKTVF